MWRLVESFLEKPWITAVALLGQVAILFMQWWILRHHGKVMEENRDIARTQAKTAQMIGDAIQQQGQILDAQFKLQKRIEEKDEREKVFDRILKVTYNVNALLIALEATYPRGPIPPTLEVADADVKLKQIALWRDALSDSTLECHKVLIPSIYIPKEAKEYFVSYIRAALGALDKPNVAHALRQVEESHKDLMIRLLKVAETPIDVS